MITPTVLPSRWRTRLLYLALFVLIGVLLASSNWGAITGINNEQGDFAANSLLIQDAKSLHLLYGNYSRVGFNHPGPAILYVLAGGELLFHDWLHLVKSPFSGQLLAVGFYNAGWALLIFAMLRRISGSLAGALLFLSVFALTAAYSDFMVFDGIWFPHLYFFPFAAMLVAVSRLGSGHADMLRALAISSGFLINGHVSFVAILGIVLLVVLAGNWLLSLPDRSLRILSPIFLRSHRRALLIATAILLLFLVPLLLASIIDPPGPVAEYLRYGRNNHGNPWRDAAGFVAMYWGGAAAVLMGVVLAALLCCIAGSDRGGRDARALLLAMFGATLGLLYYAKVGIDQLSLKYIGLFYFAVPALMLGLAALLCYRLGAWPRKRMAAYVLSALALVLCYEQISKPAEYQHVYNMAGVADLYQQLKLLRQDYPNARVVFDLEPGEGWDTIWSSVLGIQIYARRHHEDLLCVNANWHISFTRRAECRPDELSGPAAGPRFHVRLGNAPHALRGKPFFELAGLALYRVGDGPMPSRATVLAQPLLFKDTVLRDGWSPVENDFVWSIGPRADLVLNVAPNTADSVVLDLQAFLPADDARQQITVLVNDKPTGTFAFSADGRRQQVSVALDKAFGSALRISLQIARPMAPAEFGLGNDSRKLGVAFYGYTIKDKRT